MPSPRVTPPPKFPPRKPRLALPSGSVDSHLHMFGPAEKYPFAPDAQYISADATDEMYFRAQDILGLSKAVLVSGGAYGQTFDHLLDMLRRNPRRLRGGVRLPVSAMVRHAPERLVWGSDWPHTTEPAGSVDDDDLVDVLLAWCGDAQTAQRVLVENPARLYGFGQG